MPIPSCVSQNQRPTLRHATKDNTNIQARPILVEGFIDPARTVLMASQCPPQALWQSLGCSGSQTWVFTRDPTHFLTCPLPRRLQWECPLLMPRAAAQSILLDELLDFPVQPSCTAQRLAFSAGGIILSHACRVLDPLDAEKSQWTLPSRCSQSAGGGHTNRQIAKAPKDCYSRGWQDGKSAKYMETSVVYLEE